MAVAQPRGDRSSITYEVRKTHIFYAILYSKMIGLPRQARDKHSERKLTKEMCFSQAATVPPTIKHVSPSSQLHSQVSVGDVILRVAYRTTIRPDGERAGGGAGGAGGAGGGVSSSSPRRSGDTLVRSRTSGDPFDCSGMDGMQLATELQRRSDASTNAGGDSSSSSSSSTGDDEAEEQVLVILPAAIHQKHAAAAADTVGNAPGASGSVPAMRCAVCLGHGTVDQYLLRGILV